MYVYMHINNITAVTLTAIYDITYITLVEVRLEGVRLGGRCGDWWARGPDSCLLYEQGVRVPAVRRPLQ